MAGSSFCTGLGRQKSDLALQNGDTQPPQVIFWDNKKSKMFRIFSHYITDSAPIKHQRISWACSLRRDSRFAQDPPRVKRGMVSHIRGPVAARGKIVAIAENWSEGDEQELVGRQWELYGGDIGYNRKG